ncbi:Yip1 family protein [Alkalibaculum bacchi]|jgi:hypothetical protein|uniref:Yip1 family protein n=1 Tax=Alkalibaculum bacchi TaxID=645887 RepID=UPI0026F10524|nr:Yip1 family protein [Alkalibaculum bacchi]
MEENQGIIEEKQDNIEEKQSIFERMKRYIIKPSAFFEKYRENPKYLFHLIALIVITVVSGLISINVNKQVLDGATDSLTGAEAELVGNVLGFMTSPITIVLGTIIMSLIGYYIGAFIYYIIIAKIFKGEGKFNHMMVIVLLASYPIKLQAFIKSFFPENIDLSLFKTITNSVNLFTLWQLFLLITGTTVLFNMSKKKSATIFIVLFVIGVIFAVGSFSLNNAAASLQY